MAGGGIVSSGNPEDVSSIGDAVFIEIVSYTDTKTGGEGGGSGVDIRTDSSSGSGGSQG